MGASDREKWDRIYAGGDHGSSTPAAVLRDNQHLLPQRGAALELACGEGGNALLLAGRGLKTTAWDLSGTALEHLASRARSAGLEISVERRDVCANPPRPESYDVIVVTRFLDRALVPAIIDALRAGGLIFYQTFTRNAPGGRGPRNPAYRLDDNELLRLFAGLRVLVYREEGCAGDTARGFRNEAMLVAQK